MQYFEKIAPYLKDPLVLAGFAVFLFFSFGRYLLKLGIIPKLKETHGFRILRLILLYGFLLGLAIVVLGFGLKYREMSEEEQRRAVAGIASEVRTNREGVAQLAANLETMVNMYEAVTHALRHKGIPVLEVMFPESNLREGFINPSPSELAVSSIQGIAKARLDKNRKELQRAEAAGKQLIATISKTEGTLQSLADADHRRYVVRDEEYRASLPILRKIHVVDVTQLSESYSDAARVRSDYDVVVRDLDAYLNSVKEFFSTDDIDVIALSKVLTAERLATNTLLAYTPSLVKAGEALDKRQRELESASRGALK
jgi:hypothetical protein